MIPIHVGGLQPGSAVILLDAMESMDAGYRALAAKYIRRQAKQLVEQLDGLRTAEDIEFVHRRG